MPGALTAVSFSPDGVSLTTAHPQGRAAAFLVILGFLVTFAFIRTSTRLIRMEVSWWPGDVKTSSGLHIHHLFWGILLLIVAGFLSFISLASPFWQITAVGFGIGMGLTLDEYALWLYLDDVYWSDEGRSSIDAVVIALLVAGLVVVGERPFSVESGDAAGAILATAVDVALAIVTLAKKRLFLGAIAFFIPVVGLWCASRVGKPDSYWAHRFYTDETARGRRKLERSRKRFSSERWTKRLGRRLQDAIGGVPTSEVASSTEVGSEPPQS